MAPYAPVLQPEQLFQTKASKNKGLRALSTSKTANCGMAGYRYLRLPDGRGLQWPSSVGRHAQPLPYPSPEGGKHQAPSVAPAQREGRFAPEKKEASA